MEKLVTQIVKNVQVHFHCGIHNVHVHVDIHLAVLISVQSRCMYIRCICQYVYIVCNYVLSLLLQITVKNIHICYEDAVSCANRESICRCLAWQCTCTLYCEGVLVCAYNYMHYTCTCTCTCTYTCTCTLWVSGQLSTSTCSWLTSSYRFQLLHPD